MDLVNRVAEYAGRHGLLPRGVSVAVAVSGGLDSMVLLDVLLRLRRLFGVHLVVATVDHGLREASALDAAFVRDWAARKGLRCHTGRPSLGTGLGLEAEARACRMAFLTGLPVGRVALGHHLRDQAETVLLRLLRGGGLEAISGMRPRSGPFIRPLLDEGREALERHAREAGLPWREDPTNAAPDQERNRARLRVLPELDAVHGGAVARLGRAARALLEDALLLETLCDRAWRGCAPAGGRGIAATLASGIDREALRREPPATRARILRRFLALAFGERLAPTALGLEALMALVDAGNPGRALPLQRGWRLAVDRERVRCLPPLPDPLRIWQRGHWAFGPFDVSVSGSPPPLEEGWRLVRPGALPPEMRRSLRRKLRAMVPSPCLLPYLPVLLRGEDVQWALPGSAHEISPDLVLRITGPFQGP
jgi:tRNA(Ile)-lysidine synthase